MKAGLPPTLTPTQRGQTGKHIHTHTALTHTYSVFLPHANTCTVGSWMYMIIGTCVHTHARVQYMLHIYIQTHIHTHTQFIHMPNGMGQFSFHELCFMLRAKQQCCIVFVCLFRLKDNEKVCSSSLRCDGTKREREPEREAIS